MLMHLMPIPKMQVPINY